MTEKIRLLICEDHHLVRGAFIGLLNNYFTVAGEASDGEELIEKYFILRPDIVITDLDIPKMSGLQAAAVILNRDPGAKILLLTMHFTDIFISASYNLGLKGILSKAVLKDELLYAINTAAEGNIYFGAEYPEAKIQELVKRHKKLTVRPEEIFEVVTEREKEVLKYITDGLTSAEIAVQMNLTKKAIDAHRQKMIQKFNLKSSAELTKFAFDYIRLKGLLSAMLFLSFLALK